MCNSCTIRIVHAGQFPSTDQLLTTDKFCMKCNRRALYSKQFSSEPVSREYRTYTGYASLSLGEESGYSSDGSMHTDSNLKTDFQFKDKRSASSASSYARTASSANSFEISLNEEMKNREMPAIESYNTRYKRSSKRTSPQKLLRSMSTDTGGSISPKHPSGFLVCEFVNGEIEKISIRDEGVSVSIAQSS